MFDALYLGNRVRYGFDANGPLAAGLMVTWWRHMTPNGQVKFAISKYLRLNISETVRDTVLVQMDYL